MYKFVVVLVTMSCSAFSNEMAFKLISEFEGFHSDIYDYIECHNTQKRSIPHIGYGFTNPKYIAQGKLDRITADKILRKKIAYLDTWLHKHINVHLHEHRYAVLISLVYNIGQGAFLKSQVLSCINNQQLHLVPEKIALFCKVKGKVHPALVSRRALESTLWLDIHHSYFMNP